MYGGLMAGLVDVFMDIFVLTFASLPCSLLALALECNPGMGFVRYGNIFGFVSLM